MDNLNDLEAIWKTAKTDTLPSSAQMLLLVKKFRNQKLRNKILIITLSVIVIILYIFIWFIIKPKFISTTIGMLLITASCAVLAVTNIRSIKRFINFKDSSNKEYIAFMEQTRVNQLRYYQKTQPLGLVLSSAGLMLYLYEFVHQSLVISIVLYALSIIWLAYVWFYQRPTKFKKQSIKLNETIEKLQKLSHQIE
jgi:predicted neutral ceramidase superfamily lipid hydrolase